MASGWNLWVWLECIGVVSGCCCKEVYRYPHKNLLLSPTPLVLALSLAASFLAIIRRQNRSTLSTCANQE